MMSLTVMLDCGSHAPETRNNQSNHTFGTWYTKSMQDLACRTTWCYGIIFLITGVQFFKKASTFLRWHARCLIIFQCDARCLSVFQCDALCLSIFQCDARCLSVFQCDALCLSVFQCDAWCLSIFHCNVHSPKEWNSSRRNLLLQGQATMLAWSSGSPIKVWKFTFKL